MPADIVSAADGLGGTQNLGRVSVLTGGRGSYGNLVDNFDSKSFTTLAITGISESYDERFDDPRYYTGDTA